MPESSVKGLRELQNKLATLGPKLAGRVLRQATMNATTPAMKTMREAAPKGKQAHRTYKGNLVAPGFLSRSIKRKSSYKNGKARVIIGVKKEAFYGVLFVEKGTKAHDIPKKEKWYQHRVPRRNGKSVTVRRKSRVTGAWRKKALFFNGRVVNHVRHPGARAKPWFVKSFVKNEKAMLTRLSEQLSKKIQRHLQQ
ncbi:HK97 gp10 family phage protein [Sedimenticola selenatireducens]|uniref:HK97 gp10 family phage protein n=1 Tax=Sedimenticola selenatireducens TaxID=191960 RepID=UPI00164342B6|nr:HK97 gp10 family phage protein [Sedimenticola selenatireducens]